MLYKVKNMHNKKCLPAYILLFLLLIILTGCGCNIETVDEHNSKIEREALERSSALESLLNRTEAAEVSATAANENQTTAAYINVHITITCSKVIDNPGLSTDARLPKDGIMLDTYVAVRNGDSVFDALKAAADDNGISLSYTKSSGSVYLGGINGLNEKQCGRYSGWRYSVNNVYPNVGCGGYTLSDGDSILFGYVATYTDSY